MIQHQKTRDWKAKLRWHMDSNGVSRGMRAAEIISGCGAYAEFGDSLGGDQKAFTRSCTPTTDRAQIELKKLEKNRVDHTPRLKKNKYRIETRPHGKKYHQSISQAKDTHAEEKSGDRAARGRCRTGWKHTRDGLGGRPGLSHLRWP